MWEGISSCKSAFELCHDSIQNHINIFIFLFITIIIFLDICRNICKTKDCRCVQNNQNFSSLLIRYSLIFLCVLSPVAFGQSWFFMLVSFFSPLELIICISWEGKGYIFCVGSTNDISSPRFAQQMMERNKKDHPNHLNSSFLIQILRKQWFTNDGQQ